MSYTTWATPPSGSTSGGRTSRSRYAPAGRSYSSSARGPGAPGTGTTRSFPGLPSAPSGTTRRAEKSAYTSALPVISGFERSCRRPSAEVSAGAG